LSGPEDVQRALILREVFDKILLFEKTECPFQRGFSVELPERPQTPAKKPWTPVGKNLVWSPFSSDLSPPSLLPTIASAKRRASLAAEQSAIVMESDGADNKGTTSLSGTATPEESLGHNEDTEVPATNESKVAEEIAVEITKVRPAEVILGVATNNGVEESKEDQTLPESQYPGSDIADNASAAPPAQETIAQREEQVTLTTETIPISSQSESSENDVTTQTPLTPMPTVSDTEVTAVGGLVEKLSEVNLSWVPESISDVTLASGRESPDTLFEESKEELSIPGAPQMAESEKDALRPVVAASEDIVDVIESDTPHSFEGAGSAGALNLKKKRMSRLLAGRSGTMPPQLTVLTSPQSKPRQQYPPEKPPSIEIPLSTSQAPEETSPVESTDSFHSVQSWHSPLTPLPPSPPLSNGSATFPYPHENIIIPRQSHVRDLTFTPNSDKTFVPSSTGATVHTPDTESPMPHSPVDDIKRRTTGPTEPAREAARTSAMAERPTMRHRPRHSNLSISRRAFSPLPPAANLFSPPVRRRNSRRLGGVRKLPGAIIHKTVEILLSPPGHLVSLMLKVAAKIAAGEWRGLVFGVSEGGEQIPVQWDYSDGDISPWDDDDDYTFSMGQFAQGRTRHDSIPRAPTADTAESLVASPTRENDRSWEVD
jgi:hypothetical protein